MRNYKQPMFWLDSRMQVFSSIGRANEYIKTLKRVISNIEPHVE